MCLFSVAFQLLPDYPALILMNRDEDRRRPSAAPRLMIGQRTGIRWLGGTDLLAGGTWLGVNEFGLVVAVTNRPKRNIPSGVRSRGLLCRDLLECSSVESGLDAALELINSCSFAGFNLLLISPRDAAVIEAGDVIATVHLSRGLHSIANGSLNDQNDPRVQRTQKELNALEWCRGDLDARLHQARRICGLRADGHLGEICLIGARWGTVSSTVIALAEDPRRTHYYYAPGPPHETPFDDYSQSARELLTQKQ